MDNDIEGEGVHDFDDDDCRIGGTYSPLGQGTKKLNEPCTMLYIHFDPQVVPPVWDKMTVVVHQKLLVK